MFSPQYGCAIEQFWLRVCNRTEHLLSQMCYLSLFAFSLFRFMCHGSTCWMPLVTWPPCPIVPCHPYVLLTSARCLTAAFTVFRAVRGRLLCVFACLFIRLLYSHNINIMGLHYLSYIPYVPSFLSLTTALNCLQAVRAPPY